MLLLSACRTGPVPRKIAESKPDLILTAEGLSEVTDGTAEEEKPGVVKAGTGAMQTIIARSLSPEEKLMQIKEKENEQLTDKILELKKEKDSLLSAIESLEKTPESIQDIKTRTANKDTPFKKCGQFNFFQTEEWYEQVSDLLELRRFQLFGATDLVKIDLESVGAACFSGAGNILVMIIPDEEEGRGFGVLRYDTINNNIQIASLNVSGKSKIQSPIQFGKRDGNIIHLKGGEQTKQCYESMEYDFDFIQNEVTLTKSCKKCPGKKDDCEDFTSQE